MLSGELSRGGSAARVRLKLEDGSTYPEEGVLKFTDVTVDPATGSQVVRAQFPNTRGLLLPGMYVRAELVEGTRSNGILVPQSAVSRDEKGSPTVMVAGAQGKVEMRKLTAPRTVGTNWLVTAGLKPGDKVIVEGAQNLRPGATVKPVPMGAKATTGAAPAGGAPAQQQGQGQ
jgi:membrane fusion protein (multidrug efflux system)